MASPDDYDRGYRNGTLAERATLLRTGYAWDLRRIVETLLAHRSTLRADVDTARAAALDWLHATRHEGPKAVPVAVAEDPHRACPGCRGDCAAWVGHGEACGGAR